MEKILEIKNLNVYFKLKKGFFGKQKTVYAVDNVSFDLYKGETLGIVGESGCGKSSLARSLVGLNEITSGEVIFQGNDNLAKVSTSRWYEIRKDIQFIFQDPVASLNPRMTVMEIISEPLEVHYPKMSKENKLRKVLDMMHLVGLSDNQINRYPQEFSGGQCQRIGIARALILEPKLIICDESVSALDVSIKAQIINLMKDLQQKLNLTVIFISHDLSIVKHICDRVLVMYLGNIMELGTRELIFKNHYHPYTQALLSAVPIANPQLERNKKIKLIEGDLPSPINPPKGCVFSTRCPLADDECKKARPQLRKLEEGSLVACIKV
ncbi:MAG: ABC transporter ATP-binding protein [Neisseriaceae bacterium]